MNKNKIDENALIDVFSIVVRVKRKKVKVKKEKINLSKYRKDSRIESISDERELGDGVWLYLKDGLCASPCCHIVHEWTQEALDAELKNVTKCDCEDCIDALNLNK